MQASPSLSALEHAPLTQSARWRKPLLALHIIATVSVLGADLTLLTLGIASLGGADPQTIYPAAHLVSAYLVTPLALLALGSGLLLGKLTQWGLFRYWWVTIKLTITVIMTLVVLLILDPRLGTIAATVAAPGGASLPIGQRVLLVIAPALASSLLLLNVVLGVFKPGGRLRRRVAA